MMISVKKNFMVNKWQNCLQYAFLDRCNSTNELHNYHFLEGWESNVSYFLSVVGSRCVSSVSCMLWLAKFANYQLFHLKFYPKIPA